MRRKITFEDLGKDFSTDARLWETFFNSDKMIGFLDRVKDCLSVEWLNGSQIDNLMQISTPHLFSILFIYLAFNSFFSENISSFEGHADTSGESSDSNVFS